MSKEVDMRGELARVLHFLVLEVIACVNFVNYDPIQIKINDKARDALWCG